MIVQWRLSIDVLKQVFLYVLIHGNKVCQSLRKSVLNSLRQGDHTDDAEKEGSGMKKWRRMGPEETSYTLSHSVSHFTENKVD